MRTVNMVIVPPIYIVAVETAQDQVKTRRTDRNTEVHRNRAPVARRTVIIAIHNVLEAMPRTIGQFCPKQDVARRESPAQVTANNRTAYTIIPADLVNETLFIERCVIIDIETITVNIVVI